MLIINNLSDKKQTANLPKGNATNLFTHETISLSSITLQPYQYLWLLQDGGLPI